MLSWGYVWASGYRLYWKPKLVMLLNLALLETPETVVVTTPGDTHDDVIKWKHFPRYWPFVRGIHRSPVNSPHKGQWRGALMFYLICARINGWVHNGEAGNMRRYRVHYGVTVMAGLRKVIGLSDFHRHKFYGKYSSMWGFLIGTIDTGLVSDRCQAII